MLKAYLSHLIRSKNQYAIHSPFVFDFYMSVVRTKERNPNENEIEKRRKELLKNTEILSITDLGAGSFFSKSNKRSIRSIAKHSLKSTRWASFLSKIIAHYRYETILDLGTSFGTTTAYFAQQTKGIVHTFEGCPTIAQVAEQTFQKLALSNVKQYIGDIQTTLPSFFATHKQVDFVFFDANHQYEPTLAYFHQCLPYIHENSCFVFDDIHWSKEMEKAWETIQSHPDVTVSLDFYQVGVVFFRKGQAKEHFILR